MNATTISDLDHLNLIATVNDIHGVGLTVIFRDSGASIGSAQIMNIGGIFKAEIDVQLSQGTHTITAGA